MTRKYGQHDARVEDTTLRPVNPEDTGSQEPDISSLLTDVRDLIRMAKSRAATAVNVELVLLYWHIGGRIHRDILGEQRATYGRKIVSTLSRELVAEYGSGYSNKNLWRMIGFSTLFPSEEIVSTLSRQLSWSHFVELLAVKDPLDGGAGVILRPYSTV